MNHHITGQDPHGSSIPFTGTNGVYTLYHGFRKTPCPEIHCHNLQQEEGQCVLAIKLPANAWMQAR